MRNPLTQLISAAALIFSVLIFACGPSAEEQKITEQIGRLENSLTRTDSAAANTRLILAAVLPCLDSLRNLQLSGENHIEKERTMKLTDGLIERMNDNLLEQGSFREKMLQEMEPLKLTKDTKQLMDFLVAKNIRLGDLRVSLENDGKLINGLLLRMRKLLYGLNVE